MSGEESAIWSGTSPSGGTEGSTTIIEYHRLRGDPSVERTALVRHALLSYYNDYELGGLYVASQALMLFANVRQLI